MPLRSQVRKNCVILAARVLSRYTVKAPSRAGFEATRCSTTRSLDQAPDRQRISPSLILVRRRKLRAHESRVGEILYSAPPLELGDDFL
jgi:hypothetical protein